MKKLLVLSFLIFQTLVAQSNLGNAFLYKADINSKTAYKMQQEAAILIDVRTKREFSSSHAKGAINIPIFYDKYGKRTLNRDFIEQIDYVVNSDKNKEILLICRSGSRTKFASNVLANEGFTNVYNIKRGFTFDWTKTDLPIEK